MESRLTAREVAGGLPFEQIVASEYPDIGRTVPPQCPDVYAGRVGDIPKGSKDWGFAVSLPPRPADQPCIILVLESPHVREYDRRYAYTPWPANGSTGRNIRRWAPVLADSLGLDDSVGLVLLNAIPYQCSLGEEGEWRERRNRLFESSWAQGGREFFLQRLRKWYQPHDVVVNACTKAREREPLRGMVEEALESSGIQHRARRWHPAAWRTENAVRQSW